MIIVRAVAWLLWASASAAMIYLVVDVLRTSQSPEQVWGWLMMSALMFAAVSLLCYIINFTSRKRVKF